MLTLTELLNHHLSDFDNEEVGHCSISVILEKLMVSVHWRMEINEDYLEDYNNPATYQEYSFEESISFDHIVQEIGY